MMHEQAADWDLQAVVRGFTSTSTTTTNASSSTSLGITGESLGTISTFLDPFGEIEGGRSSSTSRIGEGLEDICKPFFPILKSFSPPISSITTTCSASGVVLGGFMEQQHNHLQPPSLSHQHQGQQMLLLQRHQQHRQQHHTTQSHIVFGASASAGETPQSQRITTAITGGTTSTQTLRTKKRKNMMKKVCHVIDGLSSDMWAWRKYGQKPIKGSPYPRGYYRCSSSKGCLARKQVERNRSDPTMFVVTYTADHNHPMPTQRSTLAGVTRQKTAAANISSPASTSTNTTTTPPPDQQPSCSSPTISLSPATDSRTEYEHSIKDDGDHNDNDMSLPDEMMPNYDFFMDFEDLGAFGIATDSSPYQFSASNDLPRLAKGSTRTAAGGS